jgi:hypothetical protein
MLRNGLGRQPGVPDNAAHPGQSWQRLGHRLVEG